MEIGIKVGDLMTRNFVHVEPDTSLKQCAKTMVKKRVGSLIIKKNDKLEGILTEKDMVWAICKKSSQKDMNNIPAKALMTRRVVTIKPSADIADAMEKFKKRKIRRLPVVENKKLIGMLTANDILRIDPGLFQLIAETIKIREETEKIQRSNNGRIHGNQGVCEECGAFDILYKDDEQWLCESCYDSR